MKPWGPFNERACRRCGCTDMKACVDDKLGPCWWVEDDLCSHCAFKSNRRGQLFCIVAILACALIFAAARFLGGHHE